MTPADESRDHGVLFARAYLDSKLAKLKEDQQAYLLETVKEWFDKTDNSSSEAYVASFVGPVLDVLGHVRGELGENLLTLYSDRSHQKAVALCYVVAPDKSLDQTSKGRNYAVSLIIALRKIGLKWGILTNGLLWRLYCVKEKAPFETYFQVDLGEALRTRDSKETILLAEFFGDTAFLPSETGRSRLDDNRHESDEETREIEKHLESKIESILGKICMGFIESEGKKSYNEDEKRVVFNNSIYLLYRILFVLYAEARGFLPLQNQEYYEKSMQKLMTIAKENHANGVSDPQEKTMWNILRELFDWINHGNRNLGIPPYNGGLFDDGEKPYLASHAIHDAYLSEALLNLGFTEEKESIVPIDYNDLSVRHLGGLYEGILEYQLFIAQERMVRRKEKSVYRFIPESKAGRITRADVVIEKGDVYFSQSSEERKLTGSYYTPEDIVQYIVENSLGQYLAGVKKDFQAMVKKLMTAHETAIDDNEKRRIERFIDKEILSFLESKVLSTTILDPAMGSGHFLVNASHYLTNFIIESLCLTEWENDSIDACPLAWRRRVVEKCVFGVDLNELATELTKLSLWLITADKRKPLTFLDHHLRTGNSLLGTDFDALGELPRINETAGAGRFQTSLYYPIFRNQFMPRVLDIFCELETSSEEITDVDRKKGKFKELERFKKDLENVADTRLATFFGFRMEDDNYQSLLKRAIGGEKISIDNRVVELANSPDNNFLHWWLEFPEVFFKSSEKKGEAGFDIVIGNPPYVESRDMDDKQWDFYRREYSSAYKRFDLSVLFIEKALKVLRKNGLLGMIVSNKFTASDYGFGIRRFILENCSIRQIVDVSNTKVFRDASTYPYVIVLHKESNASTRDNNTIEARKVSVEESLQSFENFYEIEQKSFLKSPNLIFSINFTREITRILDKVNDSSLVLEDLCEMKDGIHTGNVREKLILDNKANDQCKRLLTAESIDRYSIDWKGLWVDYRKDVIDETKNEYASLRDQRLFEAPEKLLTALFGLRPEVAYDSERFYANNSVKIILAKNKDVNLKYVMAVLNSTLMAFYYRTFYGATHVGSGYIQFYPQDFLRLPIKKPTEAQLSAIVKLVDQFLTLKKRAIENKDMMNGDAKQLEEEIRRMDSAIDDMVHRTYGITESEKLTIVNCLRNQ